MKKLIISIFLSLLLCQALTYAKDAQPENNSQQLAISLKLLKGHLEGKSLTPEEILAQREIIQKQIKSINDDTSLLKLAFEVVDLYDTKKGALFINQDSSKGLPRAIAKGKELHYAIFDLQQGILDNAYSSETLAKYPEILGNKKFKSSVKFPGASPLAKDPNAILSSKIKAQNRQSWGSPFIYEKSKSINPTGIYAPAGSIVTVIVPDELVGKDFSIRVGSHSWDNSKKNKMLRLDRISLVYPIKSKETLVANPMGGGIYIEVPYLTDLGIVEIKAKNAISSPLFSARSFHKTSLEEWQNIQRKNPAPWADFVSDKVMINMPTNWLYNYENPIPLMADWDKAMDAVIDLRGWTGTTRDKTILYLQADLQMRGNAYFPGYPQTNDIYKPDETHTGNKNHYYLSGPQYSYSACFHELGHAVGITKFRGEVEAIVNFLYVAIVNQKFDVDLDTAFMNSFKTGQNLNTLDEVAQMWMVKDNFRQGKDMNCTNIAGDEMKYQYTGYAKYVDFVALFGWDALNNFFRSYELDYMSEKEFFPKVVNKDDVDNRIFNLSLAAGCDVRPLIHFWGISPENPKELELRIKEANLKPSKAIYDKLIHYKSITPANNAEFKTLAKKVFPKGIKEDEKTIKNGIGWYFLHLETYGEKEATQSRKALDNIIKTYFPHGRS